MPLISAETIFPRLEFEHPTLRLAYEELVGFLERSPGASKGDRPTLGLRFEPGVGNGYSITATENQIAFRGPSEVDVLYAVYSFAEEWLGFCFFEPGVDRLVRKETIALPEGVVMAERTPLMKKRGFVQNGHPVIHSRELADWMARNRLNHLLTKMEYYDPVPPEIKDCFRVRGIVIEGGIHTFSYWIPTEKYYAEHPEYFAVNNGERVQPRRRPQGFLHGMQLCASNPGVRAEMASNMIAYCRENPEVKALLLAPNDGFGWCECEHCARFYDKQKTGHLYSVSEHVPQAQELYHDMVSDVAAQVRKVLPDITITLLAYINYIEPAKEMRLTEGMAVNFAPYWRCINHALHDPECPINSRYMGAFRKWRDCKCGGELVVYEYYMGVNLYLSLPMIHHEAIFDEVDALHALGADGVITQFRLSHWSAYGLNFYLMAKALYGDGKDSVARAFSALFGEDAGLATDFYAAMRSLQESAGFCLIPYPRSLLNRTARSRYEEALSAAQALLARKPDDGLRQALALWAEYCLRFKRLFDRYMDGEDVRRQIDALLDWLRRLEPHNLVVYPSVEMLLGNWKERIAQGKPWYHYEFEWENDYIRRHDALLNGKW